MNTSNNLSEYLENPDFFNVAKEAIEKELSNLKKIVDNVNQMRVEAAYLESDLLLIIDSKSWRDISEFISPAPINLIDVTMEKE